MVNSQLSVADVGPVDPTSTPKLCYSTLKESLGPNGECCWKYGGLLEKSRITTNLSALGNT